METQTKKQLMSSYDKIFKEYGGYRRKPWPELNKFMRSVKNKFIIDLGSGTLSTTKDLTKNNKVIAIDFSVEALKKSPGVTKVCADIASLPLKDACCEVAIAIGILHHLKPKEHLKALSEIKRALKSNGEAFISVWKRHDQKEKLIPWGKYKRYYYFFTKKELEMLARKASFSKVEVKEGQANLFLNLMS